MSEDNPTRGYILEVILTIKEEIDNHPFSKKKVTDLLDDAGIGRNSLQNKFKQVTGKTVTRYRLEKRMEEAKELLAENRLTIRQVAFKCGYKRQDQFYGDFKRVFNKAPTEYQKGKGKYNGNGNGM